MSQLDYSHIEFGNLPRISSKDRREIPDISAVYFVIKGGSVVYIGSAKNLRKRINTPHHTAVKAIRDDSNFIAWHEDHFLEILEIENHFLRHFRPVMNKRIPKALEDVKVSVYISKATKAKIQELEIRNLDELINPALDALKKERKAK